MHQFLLLSQESKHFILYLKILILFQLGFMLIEKIFLKQIILNMQKVSIMKIMG